MKIHEMLEGSVVQFKSKDQKRREEKAEKVKQIRKITKQQSHDFDVSRRRRAMHSVK